ESDEQKASRRAAIDAATVEAINVPWAVMQRAMEIFDIAEAMAESGLQASVSDAGVAACCARTAVRGAWLNVRINAATLKDQSLVAQVLTDGAALVAEADRRES